MPIITKHTGTRLEVRLENFERLLRQPRPLLKEWGVILRQDVAQTFRAGGRPPWRPLAINTSAARRRSGAGTWHKAGRSGGALMNIAAGRPLKNTSALERSFDNVDIKARSVALYSTSNIAAYHEYGTGIAAGKGRYTITPKRAKVLAIPTGPKTLSGLGRSSQTATGGFLLAATGQRMPKRLRGRVGKSVQPYKNMVFRKKVKHPGVPERPMLPDPVRITPKLQASAIGVFRRLVRTGV